MVAGKKQHYHLRSVVAHVQNDAGRKRARQSARQRENQPYNQNQKCVVPRTLIFLKVKPGKEQGRGRDGKADTQPLEEGKQNPAEKEFLDRRSDEDGKQGQGVGSGRRTEELHERKLVLVRQQRGGELNAQTQRGAQQKKLQDAARRHSTPAEAAPEGKAIVHDDENIEVAEQGRVEDGLKSDVEKRVGPQIVRSKMPSENGPKNMVTRKGKQAAKR